MLKALRDDVIIKAVYDKQVGSIIIPPGKGKLRERMCNFKGLVVSIGPEYPHKELKVGDHIVFPRLEGRELELNGEKYYRLKGGWVYGITDESVDASM